MRSRPEGTPSASTNGVESRYAETSQAGDLGYTYGTYALKGNPDAHGFYVRVWSRAFRDGVWRVALDVLQ